MRNLRPIPYICILGFLFLVGPPVGKVNGNIIDDIINFLLRGVQKVVSPSWLTGYDADADAPPDVIIEHSGYPVEISQVETPDGHILPIYRIPHGKNKSSSKESVFLMPGTFASASSFFIVSAEKALPFVLSDAGYDVWIANYRGCEGTTHKNYTRNDLQYWNFTMDEIANYDVTSIIDHIINATKSQRISAVGYSLGSTSFLVSMAANPSYNKKVRKFAALAPTCYLTNSSSVLYYLKYLPLDQFVATMDLLFAGEVPVAKYVEEYSTSVQTCNILGKGGQCWDLIFHGISPSRFNITMAKRAFKHFPTPVSARLLAQFGSMGRDDICQKYDFGKEGNLKAYGTEKPAEYYLGNNTVETMGIYGPSDIAITPENANRTIGQLGNSKTFTYAVNRSDFTHGDFLLDDEVKPLVYDKVVEFFDRQ